MKMTLKVATILTWFNLIFWGFITGLLLLGALSAMFLPGLLIAVLMSAIPLNCYAALKLHKSIRNPLIPLSQQTPMGIRFVGFIALFFGVNSIGDGFALIKNARRVPGFPEGFLYEAGARDCADARVQIHGCRRCACGGCDLPDPGALHGGECRIEPAVATLVSSPQEERRVVGDVFSTQRWLR
jgi:hypothetical protein